MPNIQISSNAKYSNQLQCQIFKSFPMPNIQISSNAKYSNQLQCQIYPVSPGESNPSNPTVFLPLHSPSLPPSPPLSLSLSLSLSPGWLGIKKIKLLSLSWVLDFFAPVVFHCYFFSISIAIAVWFYMCCCCCCCYYFIYILFYFTDAVSVYSLL